MMYDDMFQDHAGDTCTLIASAHSNKTCTRFLLVATLLSNVQLSWAPRA